jgi:hypothetical protein
MEWKIYYDNWTAFSSTEGTPWDAPRVGIIVIVQKNDRSGWEMVNGDDYYYYEPRVGGWRNTTQFGMYDHLIRCKTPLVLFGRMVNDETYSKMRTIIAEEWGPKSGWLPTEVRRGT